MGDLLSSPWVLGNFPYRVGDHIHCPQPPHLSDVAASLGGTGCVRTTYWVRDLVHLSLGKSGPCCLRPEAHAQPWQIKARTAAITPPHFPPLRTSAYPSLGGCRPWPYLTASLVPKHFSQESEPLTDFNEMFL